MADEKPETLKPGFANGTYVKYQRNAHILCIEQHSGSGTNVSTGRRQGESEIKDGDWEQEVDMK